MDSTRSSPAASALFTLAALTLAITAAYFARAILLPIALAVLLSFVLAPLVDQVERLRVGRIASVFIVVMVAFVIIGGLTWVFAVQVVELGAKLPSYQTNLVAKVRDLRGATEGTFSQASATIAAVGKELTDEPAKEQPAQRDWWPWWDGRSESPEPADDQPMAVRVVELPRAPLQQVVGWLGPLVGPAASGGLVFVLVVFILGQHEDLRNRVIQLFGTGNLHSMTRAIGDAGKRIGRYLWSALIVNATFAAAAGIGLWLIGLPNAVLWALMALLLRFLPYIGPWLAAGMPILLSLAVFDGWGGTLWVVGLYVGLEIIVSYTLEPMLYGSSIGVTSMGVILAAIFWTWLWGPVGLVVAMPLTVCLVVAAEHVPQLRFLAVLLGDRPSLSPAERFYQRLLATDGDEAAELADEFLKKASLAQFYDEVLVPALSLIERDRHAGLFSEEQEAFVLGLTRGLVEEIDEKPETRSDDELDAIAARSRNRVLCVPARDAADQITADMVGQLLTRHRFEVSTTPFGMLANEVVEAVEEQQADLVVIAVLPPLAMRNGRYLCKRLRQRYPDLPVIVGLWGGDAPESAERFTRDGATHVATGMAEAVVRLRSVAAAAPRAPNGAGQQVVGA
jgi:predicted PurR-regulated permease PerM/CheY-like chemotaxis protein